MKKNLPTYIGVIAIIFAFLCLAFLIVDSDIFSTPTSQPSIPWSTPTPTPYNQQPYPSPTPAATPTPPPTPPTEEVDTDNDTQPDTSVSFSVFQALRILHTDGTDSWKYPTSRTSLTPLTMYDMGTGDPGTYGKPVSASQAYVFFNVQASKTIAQVIFSSSATVEIRNWGESKTLVKELGSQSITKTIYNPSPNTDISITSSTLTIQQMMDLFNPIISSPYYWVIKLSDITATVTFSDGTSVTLGLTGMQAEENQLWWAFRQVYSGTTASIMSYSTEWRWI